MLKTLSDKVTKMCKLEKETWLLLDDVKDKVKEMRETVDTWTEKKVLLHGPVYTVFTNKDVHCTM